LVIGIKELENLEFLDHNTHAYFSHSFKNQKDSKKILDTFLFSKSDLYDFEYFLDTEGRRKISFGFYAGQVGAILGLLHYTHTLPSRLTPWNSFQEMLTSVPLISVPLNSVLPIRQKISIGILGTQGRCGKGVQSILNQLNIPFTPLSKDSDPESFKNFDIFYNCILLDESYSKVWFDQTTKFTKPLTIIDISCDSSKPNNPIKLYTKSTSWDSPVYKYNDLVSIIAIDNMPSLLPKESSDYFSGILTELILEKDMSIWENALSIFFQRAIGIY
jgi:saccharopine dehydrogenase (NAD+, L-lysine-forming)